jgi:hypothetical protein
MSNGQAEFVAATTSAAMEAMDRTTLDTAEKQQAKESIEKAITAAAAKLPGPDAGTANTLWRIFVFTLSLTLVLSVLGVIWTVVDGKESTSPDVIITIFTASLAGLIGLFVPATGK